MDARDPVPTRPQPASIRLPLHREEGPEADGLLLQIGEFAKRAGTNLRTLRYYEELGLLEPAQRSAGGVRSYRHTDVNRLRMIQVLQELGLTLERIRELLDTRSEGLGRRALLERVGDALREEERLLRERIGVLEAERGRVNRALEKLAECSTCELHPSQANNFCEPCQRDGKPLPDDLSALF